ADGSGQVTGVLDGFEGSPDDSSAWHPIPSSRVVLADPASVDVQVAGGRGTAEATPRYAGVAFTPNGAASAQVRSGASWGAWPVSCVRHQERLGTAEYWYSTGAATDRFKVAQPVRTAFAVGGATDPTDP